jgi:soluble lytic murein transglycosylase-like protein
MNSLRLLVLAALLALPLTAAAGGRLREWTDADGVTHLTNAPTERARAKALKREIVPKATGERTRVHDVRAWDADISAASRKYSIPAALVRAIIVAESNFNPEAVSRVGARGLMQLMPGTASDMYVGDPADPVQNIHGGTRYLRILANMFNGDPVKTIAAYNAGPEAVRRAKGVPNFAETKAYVARVTKLFKIYAGG